MPGANRSRVRQWQHQSPLLHRAPTTPPSPPGGHRRRLDAELGRDGKNFADQHFSMTFFEEEIPFSFRKFLMTLLKSSTLFFTFSLSLLSEMCDIQHILALS